MDEVIKMKINEIFSWAKRNIETLTLIFSIVAIIISTLTFLWIEIPRDPALRFWIDRSWLDLEDSIPSFPLFDITDEDGSQISICVFNDGRGVSGHIFFAWNTTGFSQKGENIQYLEGGNGTCVPTNIKALCKDNVSYGLCKDGESRNKIILGKQDITLRYKCNFCGEGKKIKDVNFTICIWKNQTLDCPNS